MMFTYSIIAINILGLQAIALDKVQKATVVALAALGAISAHYLIGAGLTLLAPTTNLEQPAWKIWESSSRVRSTPALANKMVCWKS